MNLQGVKEKLKSEEYDFLRTNKSLGKNIMLLTLGGSWNGQATVIYEPVN